MLSVGVAYFLWFLGGFGMLGFHRFYQGKVPTGLLWMFTGGFFFLGSVYDFFTLGRQIRQGNLGVPLSPAPREKEPLERAIFRTAERRQGRISPVHVAADSDWPLKEIQAALDALARRGVCELRVLKNGTVAYHFAEFDPHSSQEVEV